MFGHFNKSDFVGVLDGRPLTGKREAHLAACDGCRETLAALFEAHEAVHESIQDDGWGSELAQVNWSELRNGVRDRLLSRSVERASRIRRWTGMSLRPTVAWCLGLALLVSVVSAGGYWHYRDAHVVDTAGVNALDNTLVSAGTQNTLTASLLEASEADLVAWSEPDLFLVLGELESVEEEALRTLITEAGTGGLE